MSEGHRSLARLIDSNLAMAPSHRSTRIGGQKMLCRLVLALILVQTTISLQNEDNRQLRILQIVPGFTNSHVLFNYRLADTLKSLGHRVALWTQMEMAMLDTGNNRLPEDVSEHRVDIHFSDEFKADGLKVFQQMMFSAGDAVDLWTTGQQFRALRLESCRQMLASISDDVAEKWRQENFDLAIAHFHDLCPLALAKRFNISRVLWITHGTSLYDFTASAMGIRLQPALVPHPLSSGGAKLDFLDRVYNLLWHVSMLDFVNLPRNLLHEENDMYRDLFAKNRSEPDLWTLAASVNTLLINGEPRLDFARALPPGILYSGQLGGQQQGKKRSYDPALEQILARKSRGIIIFSIGTVTNTTEMPTRMVDAFLGAFARLSDYTILWRMEKSISGAEKLSHLHLVKWLPQKELMHDSRTRLLIAHGGYNSLLEAATAGIPLLVMPLFADQKINAARAERFRVAKRIDKLTLDAETIYQAAKELLEDESYARNARTLSRMLQDSPFSLGGKPNSRLAHALRMTMKDPRHFALQASKRLSVISAHSLDVIAALLLALSVPVFLLSSA